MRTLVKIILFLFLLVGGYNLWVVTGIPPTNDVLDRPIIDSQALVILGEDQGAGNLLGMQPFLKPIHYANKNTFQAALDPYFKWAKAKNLLNPKTIVVLPEYLGSWLVAHEEKEDVYKQKSLETAMEQLVRANLFKFSWSYLGAPEDVKDKAKYAVFAMSATQIAEVYASVLGGLAKTYGVTVVGGSMVLPNPYVDSSGNLQVSKGPLYNTTVVFAPNGKAQTTLIKKNFPILAEAGFTAAALPPENPVLSTPAGPMGVLVCADSWYPDAYLPLKGKAKFLVVPSLGGTEALWQAPWKGYNGFEAPMDVDREDYQKISEGEAWQKYSMGTRAKAAGIPYGLNVFFSGELWGEKMEGRILAYAGDSLHVLPPTTKGRLVSLWMANENK